MPPLALLDRRISSRRDRLWSYLIVFLLSLQLRSVIAKPRYIEDQHRGSSNELQNRNHNQHQQQQQQRQRVGVDNLPEALRRFRFNDGVKPATSIGNNDSTGSSPLTGSAVDPSTSIPPRLSDVALVVTVDGAIHALKRDTGLWIWTLHDENEQRQTQEIFKSPLVRSFSPKSSQASSQRESHMTNGEVDNENVLSQEGKQDGERRKDIEADDEIYILEPHSSGDIYVYHRSTSQLHRLPLSITQLVDLSPFTFPSSTTSSSSSSSGSSQVVDDDKLFVGKKTTELVGLDLRSGRLVGVFGPEKGWCEWSGDSYSQPGNKRVKGSGDSDGIEDRPEDLLYLGRTEYSLSIYSKANGLLQTLSYTSYGPSSPTSTFPSSPSASFSQLVNAIQDDGRHISPMHDGSVVCFFIEDREKQAIGGGEGGLEWTNRFSSPVVGVYDIVYPSLSSSPSASSASISSHPSLHQSSAQPTSNPAPTLLPHPAKPLHSNLQGLSNLPNTAFIGRLDNTASTSASECEYFAMSKENYPLIAFAPAFDTEGQGGLSLGPVGSHVIESIPQTGLGLDNGQLLDPAPEVLGIDGAPGVPARPIDDDDTLDASSPDEHANPSSSLPSYGQGGERHSLSIPDHGHPDHYLPASASSQRNLSASSTSPASSSSYLLAKYESLPASFRAFLMLLEVSGAFFFAYLYLRKYLAGRKKNKNKNSKTVRDVKMGDREEARLNDMVQGRIDDEGVTVRDLGHTDKQVNQIKYQYQQRRTMFLRDDTDSSDAKNEDRRMDSGGFLEKDLPELPPSSPSLVSSVEAGNVNLGNGSTLPGSIKSKVFEMKQLSPASRKDDDKGNVDADPAENSNGEDSSAEAEAEGKDDISKTPKGGSIGKKGRRRKRGKRAGAGAGAAAGGKGISAADTDKAGGDDEGIEKGLVPDRGTENNADRGPVPLISTSEVAMENRVETDEKGRIGSLVVSDSIVGACIYLSLV